VRVAGIPAYNEEKTIAKVILLAQKHVDRVIVCDDGSTDLTGDIARGLGASVVLHEANLGYGAAIQSLFKKARTMNADVLVTLDADGQHDPEEIPGLLEAIEDREADIVIGSRFLRGTNNHIPRYRRVGIRLITKMSNGTLKGAISDAQSGFRAYSKAAIANLELEENGMGISAEILMKAGRQDLKVVEVPIGVDYKGLDSSTHSPLKHGMDVMAAIFRLVAYEKPLKFLGIPGMVIFFAGVALALVFHYQFFMISPRMFIPMIFFSSTALIFLGTLVMFTAAVVRAQRPLVYLGVPGLVSLLTGLYFGFFLVAAYLRQGIILMNVGMASLAFILIGLFSLSMALSVLRDLRLREE